MSSLAVLTLGPIIISCLVFLYYLGVKASGKRLVVKASGEKGVEDDDAFKARLADTFNFCMSVFLFITYLVSSRACHATPQRDQPRSSDVSMRRQVFPGTSLAVFQAFACDETFDRDPNYNGDVHGAFLSYDYSIDCNADYYDGWQLYAILFMLVYPIGIPLGYFVGVYCNRAHTSPDPVYVCANVMLKYEAYEDQNSKLPPTVDQDKDQKKIEPQDEDQNSKLPPAVGQDEDPKRKQLQKEAPPFPSELHTLACALSAMYHDKDELVEQAQKFHAESKAKQLEKKERRDRADTAAFEHSNPLTTMQRQSIRVKTKLKQKMMQLNDAVQVCGRAFHATAHAQRRATLLLCRLLIRVRVVGA